MKNKLEFRNACGCKIIIREIDAENDIEIFNQSHDVSTYLSIDQTKQLIEFLTKQIEGK